MKHEEQHKGEFGVVGLGVMGANVALNIEGRGFSVAVFNRSSEKTAEFLRTNGGKRFVGTDTLASLVAHLKPPRRVLLMVPAGGPVDDAIASLLPCLRRGDLLIDGGNEHFENTARRAAQVEVQGVHFLGMGVSGGEEGARNGPSLMPGGTAEAYALAEPVLRMIAAQVEDGPCVTHVGPGGSGHYVKMVHNGIEYGDMQLIAEIYDVLRRVGGLTNAELADVFAEWNEGELESYLIEITSRILRRKDDLTDQSLVDVILDKAKMKGTGSWTVSDAAELHVPIPTIAAAVDARIMSALHGLRQRGAAELDGPVPPPGHLTSSEQGSLVAEARAALYAAKTCAYAQGIALLEEASRVRGWGLRVGELARIWKGGCIIRAAFLRRIQAAYKGDPSFENLLFHRDFRDELMPRQAAWRRLVARALSAQVPVPSLMASLSYFDTLRSPRLPANLTQAQRDFFGGHTYERIDREGIFHTDWKGR